MQLYGTWWCRRALLTFFYGSLYNSVVALFWYTRQVFWVLQSALRMLLWKHTTLFSSLSVAQVKVPGIFFLFVFLLYSGGLQINRPFPSSLVPLFQNECKCETLLMKMSSTCSFIFMQIKVIFIRMVLHLDSLWNRGTREFRNGLLFYWHYYNCWVS